MAETMRLHSLLPYRDQLGSAQFTDLWQSGSALTLGEVRDEHVAVGCDGRLLADRAMSQLMRGDWPKTLEELEERKRQ